MRYPFGVCSGVWCCSLVFFCSSTSSDSSCFLFFCFTFFHSFCSTSSTWFSGFCSCHLILVLSSSYLSFLYLIFLFFLFLLFTLHLFLMVISFFGVLFLFVLLCLLCLPYFTTHPSSCLSLCTSSIGQIWCCFIFKLFTLSCLLFVLLFLSI